MRLSKCKLFTGSVRKDGYGRRHVNGKRVYAHRAAYCEAHGLALEDIKGVVIRHRCDNPPCIRDDHLLAGSHADNVRDKVKRKRQSRREFHGRAKLTEKIVRTIRATYTGRYGERIGLARRFGVTASTVNHILAGRRWR